MITKKSIIAAVSAVLALVITFLASFICFDITCKNVRSEVLRLHILANSDSVEDQGVKLMVRDALLATGSAIFNGSVDVGSAEAALENESELLIKTANDVLQKNGFGYSASVCVSDEYFETRSYGDVTLPAGRYTALKVVLGEGCGHNWWCVMFPPLCLPAATGDASLDVYFGSGEAKLVQSNPDYEVRFKIVEVVERIKDRIKNG